ncbi:MAG: hypothetical protein AABY51_03790 [Deltaproteobacteria bacterium]
MNIISIVKGLIDPSVAIGSLALAGLEKELALALDLYWESAGRVLSGSGIVLRNKPDGFTSLEKNFFSALFLYSYQRAGIPPSRRAMYAAINQCLRGMVTGCDNILDDEYKKTIDTDLPQTAVRFRSIMDIMVSERVLFDILMKSVKNGEFSFDQAEAACNASLHALTKSGVQEASEEAGVKRLLTPELVLSSVHHYKTGILFQAPWAVPEALEWDACSIIDEIKNGLYQIGIGCQIMDDMVDLASDISKRRHNYVSSLIFSEDGPSAWAGLEAMAAGGKEKDVSVLMFPKARQIASDKAQEYLRGGLEALFEPKYRFMVEPSISFLAGRIGAERLISE